jgi:hypothetical protein
VGAVYIDDSSIVLAARAVWRGIVANLGPYRKNMAEEL